MVKMKDSGIEWIGEIPEDWNVKKIKYVSNENEKTLSENTDPNFEFDYVDIGSVKYGKGITDFQRMCFSKSPSRARRIVRKGDVIVSTVRTYLKSVANILDFDIPIIVSTGFSVLSAKNKIINQEFLKFSVLCESFTSMVEAYSVGITYPAINSSSLINLKIPLPPPETQKRIADYLDSKCAKIDGLKTDIQKQIETLEQYKKSVITEAVTKGINPNAKMKDSGIEWVGEIPEHWEIKPLGHILNERIEKNYPVKTDVILSLSIDIGITLYSEKTTNLDRYKDDITGYKLAHEGDLVLNSMNVISGAEGISAYFGCVSPVYYVLYDNDYENHYIARFYDYYFKTLTLRKYLFSIGKGILAIDRGDGRVNTCRLKVSNYDLKHLHFPMPQKNEIDTIVNYLDKKCLSIDSVISTKKQQLEKLEEYKKSLIFEYVTGKKQVEE